jgi:hypothetical protein
MRHRPLLLLRPLPLDSLMTRARALVQPGWGKAPNRGQHMISPDDPMEWHWCPRAPSTSKSAGQGKGTGASPTCGVMAWPKTTTVVVWVERLVDDGAGHHDDRDSGGVGWQLSVEVPRSSQ